MLKQSDFIKIRVAVPPEATAEIRRTLGRIGAGRMGNYAHCASSIKQTGYFRPMAKARPAIGRIGKLQAVEEELIETICHKNLAAKAVAAIKKAHPYEEPAIDIMPRYDIV